ncbi:TIGR03943 family protein [Nakamurella sp. A5-74]|uniref:TIGR03943 family protein n=1 Tax=Nakamurella sp. A5-74 TaxID=3158264 RepID=A0AAU8DTE1_9ACTN
MNKEAQSVVVGLLGGLLIGITVSGKFTSYVRPGFGPLLMAAGIILVGIGIVSLVTVVRGEVRRDRAAAGRAGADAGHHGDSDSADRDRADSDRADRGAHDAHGHQHDRSRAAWMILAPILMLVVVSPAALGADAVARSAGAQGLVGQAPTPIKKTAADGYAPNDGSGSAGSGSSVGRRTIPFDPLPAGPNPVIGVKDLVMRALYDGTNSVATTPVTVVGFISPAGDGYTAGYTIARMAINCCAADANPTRIHVDGSAPFPVNSWVAAVVTAQEGTATEANNYVPVVEVRSIEQVQQPTDPYEH